MSLVSVLAVTGHLGVQAGVVPLGSQDVLTLEQGAELGAVQVPTLAANAVVHDL